MAKTELTIDQITDLLNEKGYQVQSKTTISNNSGSRLDLTSGEIVNLYKTKTILINGKGNPKKIEELIFSSGQMSLKKHKKYVFVIYGHDRTAKHELEGMLMRWDLEPIVLDRMATESKTIIEQLEKFIDEEKVDYAIVLMTPDDEGHPKGIVSEKKYRPRQNVVLELGMVLGKLKRKNIAILVKKIDAFEYPSDISGVLYIPFGEKLEEDVRVKLAQEMNTQGFNIVLEKL